MSAVLIHVRDFLKTRGETNPISNDLPTQQIQLSDVVECYNNSFSAVNDTFDNSQLVIPNQQTMMSRSKNRKKSTSQQHRFKAQKKSKVNQNVHFVAWKNIHMIIAQQKIYTLRNIHWLQMKTIYTSSWIISVMMHQYYIHQ